ncbi:hypothetical protein EDC04DRAFT_2544924, partial [Pisolithus marmoratus]
DPCCCVPFGVTIKNTRTRFWFTCWAVTLISESFNFIAEPEHLIYFFCMLAFASDHELGWDPIMWRVPFNDEVQYNIVVAPQEGSFSLYQTVLPISNLGADPLTAIILSQHGCQVSSASHWVVLKDSWRDSDQDSEDKILQQI